MIHYVIIYFINYFLYCIRIIIYRLGVREKSVWVYGLLGKIQFANFDSEKIPVTIINTIPILLIIYIKIYKLNNII